MNDDAAHLEYVAEGDRFADFCLWDYEPRCDPRGRLRSSTLLWVMMDLIGCSPDFVSMIRGLRDGLGPFRTVWCVKEFAGRPSFEFYFYDYQRRERTVSVEKVMAVLAPFVRCDLRVPPSIPYFMFSLDLDDRVIHDGRCIEHINLYIGNPGSTVSSGICYNVSQSGTRLDNFYFFFQAEREYQDILGKLFCSIHTGETQPDVETLLWPKASKAEVIVVANKRYSDGVYYSRTDIEGFLAFLARASFPERFTSFVEAHRDGLSHLLYDVGIDYSTHQGDIRFLKTAFYGLL